MTLKIIQPYKRIEWTFSDSSGYTAKRYDSAGTYVESQGTRHRRKPNPLDVTKFRTRIVYKPAEKLNVVISGSFTWRRHEGIPSNAAMSMFSRSEMQTRDDTGQKQLASALAKMAGSDFNFGETLVELDQSFNMVANRLRRLYLYFHYGSKGNIKGIRQLLKSDDFKLRGSTPKKRLANAYLEYNFGWAPLINDVYTALTETHKLVTVKGARIARYSGRHIDIHSDNFWSDGSRAGASGIIRNVNVSVANQLGIINPALMAWNRLPFSFLVDWVVPISSYLAALTWDAGLSGQFMYRTRSYKTRHVITRLTYPKDTPMFEVGDAFDLQEIRYRNPVSNRFLKPDLSSNSFQLSVSKIATIGALFTQLNSR